MAGIEATRALLRTTGGLAGPKVCEDHAAVTITRKGASAVVMLSLEDYEALEETAYLLRSPKNLRRLVEAIAELESGGGTECSLIE